MASRGVPATRLRTSPCSQDQLARGLAGLQGLMSLRHICQGIRANLWRTNAPCLHPSCEIVYGCMEEVRAGKRNDRLKATTPLFSVVMLRGLKRGSFKTPSAALR